MIKYRKPMTKEEKMAKKLLKQYPFLKRMWEERRKVYDVAYKREEMIEKKYNKIAKKVGLKSIGFAYNEYCFGIDVNDVKGQGANLTKKRLLIHDTDLE